MGVQADGLGIGQASTDHEPNKLESPIHNETLPSTPVQDTKRATSGLPTTVTKTACDDHTGEVHDENDRPRTAGSTHSNHSEFDNTEDGATLMTLAVKPESAQNTERSPDDSSYDGSSFSRPIYRPDSAGTGAGFMFTKPIRQKLNYVGSYKQPAARQAQSSDVEVITDQILAQATIARHGQAAPENAGHTFADVPSHNSDGFQHLPAQSARAKQKHGKKKASRQQVPQTVMPSEPPRVEQMPTSPAEHKLPRSTLPEGPQSTDGLDKLRAPEAYEPMQESTQAAPFPEHRSASHHSRYSSPHAQLYATLEEATMGDKQQSHEAPNEHTIGHYNVPKDAVMSSPPTVPVWETDQASNQPTEHQSDQIHAVGHARGPHCQSSQADNVDHPQGPSSWSPNRSITSGATRRKSRASRRAKTPQLVEHDPTQPSSSNIIDYLQILAYKVQKNEKSASARLATERELLQGELEQIVAAKEALQDEFDRALHDKRTLATAFEKQRAKLATYEAKFKKFKTFIDGLGKDVDALKAEASTSRHIGEALKAESQDCKAERTALLEQLSTSAERSVQLKHEALQAGRELQKQLDEITARMRYVEKDLDYKTGLLSEERDRTCSLERRLASTAKPEESILRTVKSHSDAVLDKLFEIHASLEETETTQKTKTIELLKQTFAAVQALTGQHCSNADDIASALNSLERLSENVDRFFGAVTAHEGERWSVASLEATLFDSLKSLKADLIERDDLIRQNASLQAKIADIQSKCSPEDNAQIQLNEIRAELHAKARALESVNVDLDGKVNELRTLSAANADLQDNVQVLQHHLEEVQTQVTAFDSEQDKLHSKFRMDLEKAQHDMAEDANRAAVEQYSKLENELQRTTTERDHLRDRLEVQTREVDCLKTSLTDLRECRTTSASEPNEQYETLQQLAQSHKLDADNLRASLNAVQSSADDLAALRVKYESQSAQLAQLGNEQQGTIYEKEQLSTQFKDLQQARERADSAHRDIKVKLEKLEKLQQETAANTSNLRSQLSEAQQTAQRADAGLKHFQDSCNERIKEEAARAEKQIQALQERLAEAQLELQEQKAEDQRFHEQVEASWEQEKSAHKEEITRLKARITQVEVEKKHLITDSENLRNGLVATSQKQAFATERQHARAGDTNTPTARLHVPNVRGDIHPAVSCKYYELPVSHQVERSLNAAVETDSSSTPKILRSSYAIAPSATQPSLTRGPVVEESQAQVIASDDLQESSDVMLADSQQPLTSPTFTGNHDKTQHQSFESQHLSQTVQETQVEEQLPSFAAFHTSMSSSPAPGSRAPSSSAFSILSTREEQGNASQAQGKGARGFVAQNDSQNVHLQDSLSWSQEEKAKYTYRKPMPSPNSASKLVRGEGGFASSGQMAGRSGNSQTRHLLGSQGQRAGGMSVSDTHSQSAAAHSSSPDFIHDAANVRKLSTYHPVKRHASQTDTGPTADPRLARRQPSTPLKRKLPSEAVEDYEHERKKQSNPGSSATVTDTRRYSLRMQSTQSSVNDLPSVPALPNVRNGSGSRMRTLAGGSSRGKRGSKKSANNDEFSARFSQELGR